MSGKVIRFKHSLCGVKQASRSWHDYLLLHMKSICNKQGLADSCVMRFVQSGIIL